MLSHISAGKIPLNSFNSSDNISSRRSRNRFGGIVPCRAVGMTQTGGGGGGGGGGGDGGGGGGK